MAQSQFPFEYPGEPHRRKHGPAGYSHYTKYREWLRDEFEFRCVYCLRRETWEMREASWEIDHFWPRAIRPDRALEYDNLIYACRRCNNCKRSHVFPNPCRHAYDKHLRVDQDGAIRGVTRHGRRMIRLLKLDSPSARHYREAKIRSVRSLAQTDPRGYVLVMGYPCDDELPDIGALHAKVPRNTRPAGVAQSCLARRSRGELPETY
ncbi:MAG: hypothetical protein QOJ45_1383 [Verrucomicrobiota bacterium]|jgi:hypothetical protein